MTTVSVYGVGKAGLPLCCVIAESGHKVIGVGRNSEKSIQLNKGINPIPEETGLSDLLRKHVGKQLKFTIDGVGASKKTKVHIIIVPVFIDATNKPDFTNIKEAANNIARGLKKGDLVVLETTVPIGTTGKLLKTELEKISKLRAGRDFYLAMSPERMMTGYAISRYQELPKIVGGINMLSTKKVAQFYLTFCRQIIEVSSLETAEFIKISEGVYRDVNIALANELYKISLSSRIDYWEVQKAANNPFCHLHEPGSVGGHCIPVYPWFLINNFEVPLIKQARQQNDDMIKFYIKQTEKITKPPSRILVVGISFREGVKETAYTRSLPLIKLLEKRGYRVFVYDPLYSKEELTSMKLKYSREFNKAKAIILLNKYPDLRAPLTKYRSRVVDVKNILNQKP
ncbi:hypothetical protein A2313_04450 [Candidatus Roizmanbacteria bacterium RIFOXYB2_FULL_41_10]|uniref:UDP-glucose/GDP-mannose dehydrogenase C-terminal domain-containing protein n=1 Tax=Candidatus Roizmanbacteria bacterium RIFOXYA1_FULL_41_12 TaxID=1802082 RepID=A0A1F7K293_9BACT|nr:MAG: hypothetical protein A2209_04955 [Candidatus Roizmanbacteria bacterium RIFOXYA1_FULL_41_12]OGK66231.1 MAG: hypothetical protein A2262_02280 [Candidatus Roizmanbacteria bacterium RIFOXYA2_FULL_41_8]OGK66905.1 MAG: hypothetical protein A2377_03335 [Candidatus Roizmanbacteria bacterium RIFOXYB1_FULL_41_27]OGK70928.1 MAG: hypothetical protein A2403_01370 [Candidatus Roizmanbacteria bacterium RIFOXYC1_FULL_41_16]OGK71578.1 MAG: hypothetical protein A2313_04450 [Candidatus Roizmanbacteria bac